MSYRPCFRTLTLMAPSQSVVSSGIATPARRGQYLPIISGGNSVKVSARALLEMLAGRMDSEGFKLRISGERNPFAIKLAQGCSISEISLEAQGAEQDDYYVVFEFAPDPNASPLRLPHQLLEPEE